jgi:hypothetical protein
MCIRNVKAESKEQTQLNKRKIKPASPQFNKRKYIIRRNLK